MPSRNSILNNFGWKLLSLFLAALTWLTIHTSFERHEEAANQATVITSSSRIFSAIPLTLLTSPTNTNRFRLSPDFVEVEIGGEESQLQTMQARDVQAFVNITDAQDEVQFRKPIEVRVPHEVILKTINPTNASVERITRTNYNPVP